jgi:hypothetical protein
MPVLTGMLPLATAAPTTTFAMSPTSPALAPFTVCFTTSQAAPAVLPKTELMLDMGIPFQVGGPGGCKKESACRGRM